MSRGAARRGGRPRTARDIALNVLYHVDSRRAFADLQINRNLKTGALNPRDVALVTELVNGTLRWRERLDWVLGGQVKAGIDSLSPWVLNVLRMGLYQILFLDRIPHHAAVDESVKLATRYANPGAAGLVNAVLRRTLRDGEGPAPQDVIDDPIKGAAIEWSHPRWMAERWWERFGPKSTMALMEANNRRPATCIRANVLKTDRETLRRALVSQDIEVESCTYSRTSLNVTGSFSPTSVPEFDQGLFFVQDESESLVAALLDPKPGETVLDLCAAPGGKTTHIQELRNNEGRLIAVDAQENRLKRVQENVSRLGIRGVETICAEGQDLNLDSQVDRVLVDAPCSGLGVLARRADARWRKTPDIIPQMAAIQQELLEAAASHLKPGGTLVYSVCSNEPEEGEMLIGQFLSDHKDFSLTDAPQILPAETVVDGFLQMFPHLQGTDGAFAARLRREA